MSGEIIALDSYAFLINKKVETKFLDPNCTYLAILNNDTNPPWQWEFMRGGAKEIKILFESKMAINRTHNHGKEPRNTLFIFEISDEWKPKIIELREKYEAGKKAALPRFLEICKFVGSADWFRATEEAANRRHEYNKLTMEFGFDYYKDYKYPKK